MFRRILMFVLPLVGLLFFCMPVSAAAAGVTDLVEEMQDKLQEAMEDLDEQTTQEIFDFLREKEQEGSLDSAEGIREAMEEGVEKFNGSLDEEDIRKTVEVMGQLEDMGFDIGAVIEKAEKLYEEHGSEFVYHTQELVTETIKESAGAVIKNMVQNFFSGLWSGIKNFFANLF